MPASINPLAPHYSQQPTSVRRAFIQNLTDLLHVCLLRRDAVRARRAWGILIRCREVDWRSRWYWGLECLNLSSESDGQLTATFDSEYEGREAERWLKSTRVSAKELDKPSLLHALVLHLIKHGRFRQALDELETYVTSYPYLLSGSLHTYAGLLSFYLAQPASVLTANASENTSDPTARIDDDDDRASRLEIQSVSSRNSNAPTPRRAVKDADPPNPILIRQARAYFVKALTLDERDEVAKEFIETIDHPEEARERSLSAAYRSHEEVDIDEEDGMDSDGKSDEEGAVTEKEEQGHDIDSDAETDLEDLAGLWKR